MSLARARFAFSTANIWEPWASAVAPRIEHMFDLSLLAHDTPVSARLQGLVCEVGLLDGSGADDAERIDQIRALEELKAAVAAAQARVTVAFAASQEAAQVAGGAHGSDVGRGVASQVALAKRESPARARRYVGWAEVLVGELPRTLEALRRGETTEWRAMIVARETGWLSAPHRATVDDELAGQLESLGDRQVEAETKKMAYRLDPQGFVDRARRAERDRRVTLRPAPDTMARLTALLPVAQGVAAYAALRTCADTLLAEGDERGRGQLMADALVERLTGQETASSVPVSVGLVMTDRTLFNLDDAAGDEPAHVEHYGPVPADLARRLVLDAPSGAGVWLRRLYATPSSGRLVAMESRSRCFDGALREFLVVRDQFCRTPWCGAPIRQADHVEPVSAGGVTSASNGQGLCAACNYAKQAPGWRAVRDHSSEDEVVATTTPTGHRYRSRAPDPPGSQARESPFARAGMRSSRPGLDGAWMSASHQMKANAVTVPRRPATPHNSGPGSVTTTSACSSQMQRSVTGPSKTGPR